MVQPKKINSRIILLASILVICIEAVIGFVLLTNGSEDELTSAVSEEAFEPELGVIKTTNVNTPTTLATTTTTIVTTTTTISKPVVETTTTTETTKIDTTATLAPTPDMEMVLTDAPPQDAPIEVEGYLVFGGIHLGTALCQPDGSCVITNEHGTCNLVSLHMSQGRLVAIAGEVSTNTCVSF